MKKAAAKKAEISKGKEHSKPTLPTKQTDPPNWSKPRPSNSFTRSAWLFIYYIVNSDSSVSSSMKKQVEDLVGQMFAEFTATEYEENEDGDKYIYVRAGGEVLRIVVSRDGSVQFFGDE
uniref:Uncharacterized protein n=1 Tax=Knipowitschia caucasica TaxID=637954 RepID=A0AAV2K1J0_KNICA